MSKQELYQEGKEAIDDAVENGADWDTVNSVIMRYASQLPVGLSTALVDYADEAWEEENG